MKKVTVLMIDGDSPQLYPLSFILEKHNIKTAVKSAENFSKDDNEKERFLIIDSQTTDLDLLRSQNGLKNIFNPKDNVLLIHEYGFENQKKIFKKVKTLITLKKPFKEDEFLDRIYDLIYSSVVDEDKNVFFSKEDWSIEDAIIMKIEKKLQYVDNKIERKIKDKIDSGKKNDDEI